ncbi:MAG TPA: hypothetical protein VM537_32400 [Anaerolineae bacterium]|nr:hypothetical protein [Anaerolineae bacterium]
MAHKRRKGNRLVVVLLSDTHAGHKLGLLNPETVLIDEHGEAYSPGLTTTQRYLWELYQGHINSVADLADRSPVILIHNGDITQGTRYPSHLTLPLISDQVMAGAENLAPWYEHKGIDLQAVRIIVGTAAHGWEGAAEALVSTRLSQRYPKMDTKPLYHAQIALTRQRGQVVDCAHHGPFPGGRAWLIGNGPRYYLKSAMMEELIDGITPPRVYARAHYHVWVPETVRIRRNGQDVISDLVITPSYSGIDDYVRRATRSKRKIDHGLVCLVFEDGLREIVPLYQELDIRTREEM